MRLIYFISAGDLGDILQILVQIPEKYVMKMNRMLPNDNISLNNISYNRD